MIALAFAAALMFGHMSSLGDTIVVMFYDGRAPLRFTDRAAWVRWEVLNLLRWEVGYFGAYYRLPAETREP